MLNRLKNLLALSKYEPKEVRTFDLANINGEVKSLGPVKHTVLVDSTSEKGEFLSDMTEEEVLAYEREERLGWKGFKIFK